LGDGKGGDITWKSAAGYIATRDLTTAVISDDDDSCDITLASLADKITTIDLTTCVSRKGKGGDVTIQGADITFDCS